MIGFRRPIDTELFTFCWQGPGDIDYEYFGTARRYSREDGWSLALEQVTADGVEVTDVDQVDRLWDMYLDSHPEATQTIGW